MTVTLTATGFDAALRHVAHIQAELRGEQGTVYQDIGEIVDDSILANFAAAGRPTWPPRTRDYPHPILNKTGAMGGRALEDTQNWRHLVRVHHLDIRSTFYGIFHQYGTSRLPMRKFVQLVESEKNRVLSRLRRVFEENN